MMEMALNPSLTLCSSQQSKDESKPGPKLTSQTVCISVTIKDLCEYEQDTVWICF